MSSEVCACDVAFTSSYTERDSAGWDLEKEEVQRRRMSFWEFYNWDAWSVSQPDTAFFTQPVQLHQQSVITGRPPVLNLSQADCRFPEDMDSVMNSQGQLEPGCKQLGIVSAVRFD